MAGEHAGEAMQSQFETPPPHTIRAPVQYAFMAWHSDAKNEDVLPISSTLSNASSSRPQRARCRAVRLSRGRFVLVSFHPGSVCQRHKGV